MAPTRLAIVACCVVAATSCLPPEIVVPTDAGVERLDASVGVLDAGRVDAGGSDASLPLPDASIRDSGTIDPVDSGVSDGGALFVAPSRIPDLVICQPGSMPFVSKSEMGADTTYFNQCTAVCSDWHQCTTETTVRGVTQIELSYVVNEDGQGNGFGGTLRFTKNGARDHVVMFHKGGSGTDWVEDFLPAKVEAAGGIAFQPKWIQQGPGWFARPFAASRLEHTLYGVSLRVAATMKWIYENVAQSPIATVGCSGGSIATYYPRHWHELDPMIRYQLLAGGPVMSKLNASCGGDQRVKGRCTLAPDLECQDTAACGNTGGTCSPYEWGGGAVMTAVRATIDHLHADAVNGANDCLLHRNQPAFTASDFDVAVHPHDSHNEHRIDFMTNVGGDANADDVLNVVSSGAAVYSALTGTKSWNPTLSGQHCDVMKTEGAWDLIRVGAGL